MLDSTYPLDIKDSLKNKDQSEVRAIRETRENRAGDFSTKADPLDPPVSLGSQLPSTPTDQSVIPTMTLQNELSYEVERIIERLLRQAATSKSVPENSVEK